MNKIFKPSLWLPLHAVKNFRSKGSTIITMLGARLSLAFALRNMLLRFIILSFALSVHSSCFPDKSPEIEKQQQEDKAMGPMEEEVRTKYSAFRDALKDFSTTKYPNVLQADFKPEIFQKNDLEELFNNKFIPYLQANEKLLTHYITHNINVANRSEYKTKLGTIKFLLKNIPIWLQDNDVKKMHQRIKIELN